MEYHKIETLYERNPETFKVKVGEFKNRTYTIPRRWHFTEKIDGTNIRVEWTPAIGGATSEDVLLNGAGQSVTFGGKSAEAQIHAQLVKRLQELFPADNFTPVFPDAKSVILYGEGYGPGIQKHGGLYIDHKDFILFDVLVDHKWWLNWESKNDVAHKLGIPVVPEIGLMTLEEATEKVRLGFPTMVTTRIAGPDGTYRQSEGLVGQTEEPLFDKKGHRLIVKLKTKDF